MFENILEFLKTLLFSIPFLYTIESYPMTEQLDIQDIFFNEEYIYFITEDSINIFNSEKRSFSEQIEKPINSSISISKNGLLICTWENFEIDDPEEYSTKITIYKYGEERDAETFEFHETLKTSNCSENILLLETSLPQLEKKYFKYDIDKEKFEEYENDKGDFVVDSWRNEYNSITVKRNEANILWIYRKIFKI